MPNLLWLCSTNKTLSRNVCVYLNTNVIFFDASTATQSYKFLLTQIKKATMLSTILTKLSGNFQLNFAARVHLFHHRFGITYCKKIGVLCVSAKDGHSLKYSLSYSIHLAYNCSYSNKLS